MYVYGAWSVCMHACMCTYCMIHIRTYVRMYCTYIICMYSMYIYMYVYILYDTHTYVCVLCIRIMYIHGMYTYNDSYF